MLEQLMSELERGPAATVVRRANGPDVTRGQFVRHVHQYAALCGPAARTVGAGNGAVWVAAGDPYRTLTAALGCLHVAPVALVDRVGPAALFDRLAEACPPRTVVLDDPGCDLARWVRTHNCGYHLVERDDLTQSAPAAPPDAGWPLRFFTSGTTGTPKCVGVGAPQLLAATRAVGARLALTPQDTALSVAPLTHVLGLVTGLLAPLLAGGVAALAEPTRTREFLGALARLRPTWWAASPSSHHLVYRLLTGAGRSAPDGLRFLRTASAPIAADLADRLENYFGVPLLSAYAMTEVPGEIASQTTDERRRGTVGRPSLCEVDIRVAGESVSAGVEGDVWVRGPNVVPTVDWFSTGDVGRLDVDGYLRLTGRRDDTINHGGVKVWPPDVEAVALADPCVHTAVAFPIPDDGLGEVVGLAVVAVAGTTVDRAALRRRMAAALPRSAVPSDILVCADIPRSARGKLQRRELWRQLPHLRAATVGVTR